MDVERIVSSLSEPQKLMILGGTEIGCFPRKSNGKSTGASLVRMGLAVKVFDDHYGMLDWTEAGHEVRDHLRSAA